MIRWCCFYSLLVLATTTARPVVAQKLESTLTLTNSEMTHKDDLFIGTAQMILHTVSDGKKSEKGVTVLFITKDRIVYREKENERAKTKAGNDVTFVKLVQEIPKAPDREWVKKDGKIDGPLVPPETIDLSPAKLSKEQMIGFLVERAEVLYAELNSAMATRNKTVVDDLVTHSELLKKLVNKAELGKRTEELFDLKHYVEKQEQLIKQRAGEFEAIRELKFEASKLRDFAQTMFNLRQTEAFVTALARGADYLDSDDPADLARTVSALGRFGQAAAQRRIDQQQIDVAAKAVERKLFQKIVDLNTEIQQNQTKLTDRLRSVWTEQQLDEKVLKNLDRLAAELLDPQKQDVAAALEVLDARLRYTKERGMPSPQLIKMRNNLQAMSFLKRDPASMADRLGRAEKIAQLGRDTIESVKMIPDGSLFDVDRIQIMISGAKLIQLAVGYACEPFAPISEPTTWDVRADYAARVLKIALSYSTVMDPGGHARLTRGVLLLQRGLPVDALAQVETHAKLWEKQPLYMVHLTRIACQNNAPRQAAEYFQTALKAGFRASRDLSTDKDFQVLWTMKPQPQFLIDRDKPNLVVFLTMNPLTVKNNFQTYDVKIVNQGSHPLVDVTVRCDVEFTQGRMKGIVSSKFVTIPYVGPAGSSQEDHFVPDAFQVSGLVGQAFLRVQLAPKNVKVKPPVWSFSILKGNNTFYHRWWWYYY